MGRWDDDFIRAWFIGEMINDLTTDDANGESGCGTFLFWAFIAFILFCIYAISGVEFSKIWSFLKIVTFPVTWDYQLLDFRLFGTNNYYSTLGSLIILIVFFLTIKLLDKLIIKGLEGKVLNMRIGRFPPVATFIKILTVLYELFSTILGLYIFILMMKICIHAFLSFFTFIFSL